MKAALIAGKGLVELREMPTPRIGAGELLVRMKACGICGTDLEKMHGDHITPPILGHEAAGIIEQVGADIAEYSVGDRVVVHHHVSCGRCSLCKRGFETLCEDYPRSNLDPCGFAELFRVPDTLVRGGSVYRLANSTSFEDGSQVEPTACCIRALNRIGGIMPGSSAVVFGLGPVGLTHLRLVKHFGASRAYGVEVIEKRREYGRELGADETFDPTKDDVPSKILKLTDGLGVDLAIVATANMKALESSFALVRKGGAVLLFGAPTRGSLLTLDVSQLFLREVRFQPSYSTSETEMRSALALIESGRIKPSAIITNRLPLSQTVEALMIADRPVDAIKVIVQNS